MNYINHNVEEHKKFKELMGRVEESSGNKKVKVFYELYANLHGHHLAEEEIVFPKLKEKAEGEDLEIVREMIEEHHLGNYQFSIINRTSEENETWDAKFAVLKEVLEHHMEEEEDELAKVAKKLLSTEELEALMDEFEKVYEKKMEEKKKELKI